MKKLLLIGYIVLSTSTLFAQLKDSANALVVWNNTGDAVHGVVSIIAPQYSGLVLAIFGASSAIISLIFSFAHRKHTIKKWLKDGKLTKE